MELSLVGNGYHRHVLRTRLPTPYSVMASASHAVPSLKNNQSNSVAILPKEPQFLPGSSNSKLFNGAQKRHSKSYLERQSAIAQVKDCSELAPALARYGGLLKPQDLNVILRHFGMLNRWKDLSQLFEWMQETGKTNISSYSSYIKFMGRGLNPLKALEVYNNIQEVSIKNSIFICNSILNCLVRNGKFDTSVKLFHQMKNDGLCPDTVTYSTMLTGCIRVKHGYAKAMELLKELQDNGLCMDCVLYGTLIAICASHNRLEDAESFFNQMRAEGHSPNMFHYGSLLNAYSINGDYKKADELIEDMKLTGLVPNKLGNYDNKSENRVLWTCLSGMNESGVVKKDGIVGVDWTTLTMTFDMREGTVTLKNDPWLSSVEVLLKMLSQTSTDQDQVLVVGFCGLSIEEQGIEEVDQGEDEAS
ncbi:pentatricopeptide repeat-containing protein [Cucumis melo var. makuwa]|uniref:Pentatricopeptide repeat-containing protein n=1 Tax=Cucumis melo var. makuwa TaxID=1194695 RepID=A0A5A7URC2_CUCMM|nr:pentatricopeptide repeat-containing protein [Cucumis melo var. makuwa]